MTVRHAPLFVIALPFVITGLELAGASPTVLMCALFTLSVPILLLPLLPGSNNTRSRRG
ncbi:hypothetical protein ACFRAQ_33860 [Nocardia sp. NPDC056611]|uniref:hypothetical protein n=1 Tax=Nocardia sp. NPDC056611 TaxID=3345877 RepID=UPI00366CE033